MPKRDQSGVLEAERQRNKITALCFSCPDANHSFCYDIFNWQLRLNAKLVSKVQLSEKATKICAIFLMVLTLIKYVKVKTISKFVAFSES